jgi:hypothetical protein
MDMTERLIRDLCRQDENTSEIRYSEEEIQGFLMDKHPFIARLISGSIKGWKTESE